LPSTQTPCTLARNLSESPMGLQAWQQTCREHIHTIYEACFQNHVPILKAVQEMSWPTSVQTAKDELICVVKRSHDLSEEDALLWVEQRSMFVQKEAMDHTLINTHVYQWRFDDASLWRGQPDTSKVCALAKSFICAGFKKDSPICSRDNVMTGFNCMRFGDGQARGVALRLAWTVLKNNILSATVVHSPSLQAIVDTLVAVPTLFEIANDEKTKIVRQAVRQNLKATMTLPVNTVDWATIIVSLTASNTTPLQLLSVTSAQSRKVNAKRMLDMMASVTQVYNAQVDAEGVVISPPMKRPRRGRRSSKSSVGDVASTPVSEDQTQSQIRIGAQKIAAIKNMLSYATETSFNMMSAHLVWAGDFKYSGLSDAMLAHKHLWPGSPPNPAVLPNHSQYQISLASQKACDMTVPQRLRTSPMHYDAVLTYEMHEMLVTKVLVCFEDEALHVTEPSKRLKFRPTVNTLDVCRLIIQHWQQSIKQCAQQDLSEEDFKELEAAVLYGDAMDSHIKKALDRFPVNWNMSMLPDLKAGMPEDCIVDTETLLEKAELDLWNAKLDDFSAKLKRDQIKIQTMHSGSSTLQDQLEWIRHMKMVNQASTVSQLVEQFTTVFEDNLGVLEITCVCYCLKNPYVLQSYMLCCGSVSICFKTLRSQNWI
jgi:hypothetical protein